MYNGRYNEKTIAYFYNGGFALFSIYLYYLSAATINPKLQIKDVLLLNTKNYANYLTNHLTYGHQELEKYTDFTGEFASSRVKYVGYATPQVIENVSSYNQNYKESIDGLFAAIYHRVAFLDFRSDDIGI